MAQDSIYPRWEVINECIRALDNTLVNISTQLVNLKELPISIDEVEICLNQLQKTIHKARVKDWASELVDDVPSPQMSQAPRGPLYG